VFVGSGMLLLIAAVAWADRMAASGVILLGSLSPWLEPVFLAWERVEGGLAATAGAVRIPVLLGLLAVTAWLYRRHGLGRSRALLLGLGMACLAQVFLLGRSPAVGVLSYGLAIAILVLGGVHRSEPGAAAVPEPAPGLELALILACLGLFLCNALYLLDVHPDIFLDEKAYAVAARMALGELEPGSILPPPLQGIYILERFQAQPIALGLHSAAVALFSPGVLPLRLASVLAGGAALLVAGSCLRRPLGWAPALCLVALGSVSAYFLDLSRLGFYLAFSVLQAALTFAVLISLMRRDSAWKLPALAALLASSIYLYQLSWFVPVMAGLSILLVPEIRRRVFALPRLLPAGLVAAVVLLPVLWLPKPGLEQIKNQTVKKTASFSLVESEPLALGLLLGPEVDEESVLELHREFVDRGVPARLARAYGGQRVLLLLGPPEAMSEALRTIDTRGSSELLPEGYGTAWRNGFRVLARLVYAPGWGTGLYLVDGPLLSPVVTPFVFLGLFLAVARWRSSSALRLLAIWVLVGALLPPLVARVSPRRMLLLLPFVYGLAGVALVETVAVLPGRLRGWLKWAAPVVLCLLALLAAHSISYTFDVPFHRLPLSLTADDASPLRVPPLGRPSLPRLGKLLRSLAGREVFVVLAPDVNPQLLERIEEIPLSGESAQVHVVKATDARAVRRVACSATPPFAWVQPEAVEARTVLSALRRDHVVVSEKRGAYRVFLAQQRVPSGCALVSDLSGGRG
jgi:hypothetical protein